MKLYLFMFYSAKFWAFFALFGRFGAIFGVWVSFKNFFWTCLHRLTIFILEVELYLASLKLSWGRDGDEGVGVVGHCDFNKNQVVSFGLLTSTDDFGFVNNPSHYLLFQTNP